MGLKIIARVAHFADPDAWAQMINRALPVGVCKEVTEDMMHVINGLREQVKNQLTAVIHKPIKRKCDGFVKAGKDIGPGVKARMLEDVFERLVGETTDAASDAAEALLLQCFELVRKELGQVMKDLDDPLESATEVILSSHRGRLERADGRNRDRVLESVAQVVAARPLLNAAPRDR